MHVYYRPVFQFTVITAAYTHHNIYRGEEIAIETIDSTV